MTIRFDVRLVVILVSTGVLMSCSNPEGDFKKAEQTNSEQALNEFIKKHPESPLVAEAKARIAKNAYEEARNAATVTAFEGFLKRFQSSELVQQAKTELEALEYAQAVKAAAIPTYEAFLHKYPQSTNASTARKTLAQLEYDIAVKANDIPAYEGFLAEHADSELAADAKIRLDAQFEERDWNQALLKNASDAYLSFYRGHTNTDRVKILTGTVRAEIVYGFTASPLSSQIRDSGIQVTLTIDNNSTFNEEVATEDAAHWNLITYNVAGYTAEGQAIAMTGQKPPLTNATMIMVKGPKCAVSGETGKGTYKIVSVASPPLSPATK